jgi:4-hydroxy-tetrahydrodipicolinate synthase
MEFRGVYTAIITPFKNGGTEIDYPVYRKLIERQVEAAVAGVVPCGTTGESPTLSHAEHSELIRKTVEFAAGRIRVIAGTGSNSTAEAIEFTQSACRDGVDAVMLVNPYYNKPSQEGLYQHFKKVAEVSTRPVVIYNIRGRTAVNVEVETFQRLADVKNIAAVKEASGDPGQMARFQRVCGERLTMLSGDDNIIPAVMGLGGHGVISVASNLYPKRMVRMMDHYLKGDFKTGNDIFYTLLDMMNALFWETNPGPVKAAAEILGLCEGSLRLPLVSIPESLRTKPEAVLSSVGGDA